jgi:hypothetical protein
LHLRILDGGLRRLHKRAFAWINPGVAAILRFAIAKVIAMSDPRTTDYRLVTDHFATNRPPRSILPREHMLRDHDL